MNIYETVTARIAEALDRGVVPWRKPWNSSISVPVNVMNGRPYRGVNLFLLSMARYSDHRWLTYRQALQKGGTVRRGERSTPIIFWKRWKPKDGESEDEKRQVPLLRSFSVFNAEQCEGLDLPELHRPPALAEHERVENAELLIRHMPNPPTMREAGHSAWYSPKDDLVCVPPLAMFESADAFYATLLHELGHATGHESRLGRKGVMDEVRFGSSTYGREELVAELASAFCCAAISLDNSIIENAASYIQGWLGTLRHDPKAMVVAAAQAQRAADYIRGVTWQ